MLQRGPSTLSFVEGIEAAETNVSEIKLEGVTKLGILRPSQTRCRVGHLQNGRIAILLAFLHILCLLLLLAPTYPSSIKGIPSKTFALLK
jgi:hypothetical protein